MTSKLNPLDVAASVAVGAVGAVVGAAGAVAAASAKAFSGEAQFFDETVTPERIKHLLDNTEITGKAAVMEKVEGMKYILAQMARGRDASEFYPDVVRNVITKAVELKKLVYSYLVAYADFNATCRELALLAINSFQRDLSDANQLIRAMALRVLASIRVREIVQIQLMSLKKCASDSSPYVRKTAAHACGKIFQTDADAKGEIVEVLEKLLADRNTQVLSSAVAAFNEVCPEDLALLHPHYRKLCGLLADLDDWGQITALGVLTRYARTFFAKPAPGKEAAKASTPEGKKGGKKKGKDFYSDDESSSDDSDSDSDSSDSSSSDEESEEDDGSGGPKVPEDHALLLRVAAPLLRSRNSGVVLAVAQLYAAVGEHDTTMLPRVGRSLVRVARNHRELQFVVLTNIVGLAKSTPDMFRKYLKDFFVAESEPAFVRRMKVDVLAALICADNAAAVLREFTRYVKDDDKDFVRHAIQAVVRVANALPEAADKCLRGLMGLVSSDNDAVVAEAVVAIRQLLQQNPTHDGLIVRLVKRLDKIASPSARAAIVWVLGEFQATSPKVGALAPDVLRQLAKGFRGEAAEVKAQIVNLAAKTSLLATPGSAAGGPVSLLFSYVLDLARYDTDYDLRDRARTLRYLVLGTEVTQLADDATEEAGAVIALKRAETADADQLAAEVPGAEGGEGGAAVAAVAASSSDGGAAAPAEGAEGAAAPAAAEGAAEGSSGEPAEGARAASPAPPVAPSPPAAAAPAPAKGATARLQDRVAAVLLAAKPPPTIAAALEGAGGAGFSMGSLSSLVGHAARGYHCIPEWAAEGSPAKLRDPPKDEDERKKPGAFSKKGAAAAGGRRKAADSSDDDSDSSSDDDSDSDSDSSEASSSESEEEEDSEESSEEESSEDESSSEEEDSSDDDESDSD